MIKRGITRSALRCSRGAGGPWRRIPVQNPLYPEADRNQRYNQTQW